MLYKLKIYRYDWHMIDGKLTQRITRESVIDAINKLNLKTVRSVKQNKKPFIMIKLTSEEEYGKLKRHMKKFKF